MFCYRAEAIFGDIVQLLYNDQVVWMGVLNNGNNVVVPERRFRIPGVDGGTVMINQWYFGGTQRTVFTQQVLPSSAAEDFLPFRITEGEDRDPDAAYELICRTTLESWAPLQEISPA